MSDSRTPEEGSAEADDGPERPPRYERVGRVYKRTAPEVWGPQQNAVVNGQIENAQMVDVSAGDRKRIREFADETLRAEQQY